MPDVEGLVRATVAANDRTGGEPFEACRARLAGAGLQHLVAPSEGPECRHPLPAQHGCVALADRQHRDQIRGRRGMVSPPKHGPSKPRQWRKVHLGIDADTLEIRAIEVTGSRVGDAPMLPELLRQIPADQPIDKVSADGAYDTRACHAAIADRNACAVIPSRKNARPWLENTPGARARNDTVRSTRRLGRAIWRRWSGYHRRSLVETKMRCFKLLGERVMARDFDRQVAELQIKAAILNRFTALGTPQTQRVG